MDWFLYDNGLHHERVKSLNWQFPRLKRQSISSNQPFNSKLKWRVILLTTNRKPELTNHYIDTLFFLFKHPVVTHKSGEIFNQVNFEIFIFPHYDVICLNFFRV